MAVDTSDFSVDPPKSSDAQLAVLMWTFVQQKSRPFTSQMSQQVLQSLLPLEDQSPKTLARRLQKELDARGVHLKYNHALELAARLRGAPNWQSARKLAHIDFLTFTPLAELPEEKFGSWEELAPRLISACEQALRQAVRKVIQVRFRSNYISLDIPMTQQQRDRLVTESIPVAMVSPVERSETWLNGSVSAFERVRRSLEETDKGILDGIAVLKACANTWPSPNLLQQVSTSDAPNSELVLSRDDSSDPYSSNEIARGDEMVCWWQLELAEKSREISISEEDGAWHIGDARYIWHLITLHPKEYVPGLVIRNLGVDESKTMLRRYLAARRILGGSTRFHESSKQIEYLGGPTEKFRVDIHLLLREMQKAEIEWDEFCKASGLEEPISPLLSAALVLSLIERLRLANPNAIIARPPRSEMMRLETDEMIRALLPRVNHFTYHVPQDLDAQTAEQVREAVASLAESQGMRMHIEAGVLKMEGDPLPHLVYAGDGEELRSTLESLGLVPYVAVIPHWFEVDKSLLVEGMWPFAFGYSLYLDIVRVS
jgi:hypothetical protein